MSKDEREKYWTGVINNASEILHHPRGERGRDILPIERKILLCEGLTKRKQPGMDKALLEKVAKPDAGWEVYDCGDKLRVRNIYDELLEDGPWGELLAVVDLDEPSKKKPLPKSFLVWPRARDLECFLLGSEAWPRVLRTVLNRKADLNIQPPLPPYEPGGAKLPEQFAIDESACAHAWRLHLKHSHDKSVQFPHTVKDPENPRRVIHPEHFEFLNPESMAKPRKIPSELNQIISTIIDVSDDYGEVPEGFEILEADERLLTMQGKRAMSLLAARIYSETYLKKDELGIPETALPQLWKSLKQPGFCSKLRSLILDYVTEEEMRGHFPELA